MANTRKISVAKAMKVKNRLAGRLNKVQTDIQHNNSRLENQPEKVNVRNLLELRSAIVEGLLELKTAIDRSTYNTIDRDIRLLGEKKAELTFLASISTNDGPQANPYAEKDHIYTAIIKQPEIDQKSKLLEREIDEIQDRLDEFNASTKIEVAEAILTLAS